MISAATLVNAAANRAWAPPPEATVSEWSEANIWLGGDSPAKGPYRIGRTPYVRGVMDCLSPNHPARWIVWEAGSQVGKTRCSLNWVGFKIDHDPTPMIITLPSEGVAREWSDQRFSQLLEDTECLRGKVIDSARKGSGNTKYLKRIRGTSATIKIAWSSSAKKLRSTPAADLLSDEVDGFEGDVEGEGDPIALLNRRFTNFPRGKHYMCSTPGSEPSRIHREFLRGDQRYYFLPCPECGHFQRLVFKQIRWPHRPAIEPGFEALLRYTKVAYTCLACQAHIAERHKTRMLAAGMWLATAQRPELRDQGFAEKQKPELEPILTAMAKARFASFNLAAYYSPLGWYSWSDLARDWEASENDTSARKTLINTVFAEVWKPKGKAPAWKPLYGRREAWKYGTVPQGALFLTLFCDVQANRLEAEVKAWGPDWQNWSVWYEVIAPERPGPDGTMVHTTPADPEPWERLGELILQEWPRADGAKMRVWAAAVDSGGGSAERVYKFCRQWSQPAYGPVTVVPYGLPVVVPTKGGHSAWKLIEHITDTDAAQKREGLRVVTIGTHFAKEELYSALSLEKPLDGVPFPPRYCHHPDVYDESYFQGLTAETRIMTARGIEWHQDGRNEPLDCHVGNRAIAELCAGRMAPEDWDTLARLVDETRPDFGVEVAPAPPPTPRDRFVPRRNWFNK